jgi:hypothetical protein
MRWLLTLLLALGTVAARLAQRRREPDPDRDVLTR